MWVKQFVSVIWENKEEITFAKEYTFWNPSKTCQNISWERHLGSYSNRKLIYFIMSENKFPPDPSEKADVLLSNKAINFQNMGCHMQFVFLVIPCTYIYNFQGRNSHLNSVQSCYQISFSLQVLLSVVSIMSFEQQYDGIYQWDGPWISWKHLTLGFCLSFFFSFLYNNNGETCVLRIVCFFGSLFWLSMIHLSTFFCLSGAGQGGCNLSRKAQTSHSPPTSSSLSGGTPSRSQASREI